MFVRRFGAVTWRGLANKSESVIARDLETGAGREKSATKEVAGNAGAPLARAGVRAGGSPSLPASLSLCVRARARTGGAEEEGACGCVEGRRASVVAVLLQR